MQVEFLEVIKPSNVAVSAARTCYFPNGIVPPEKSEGWARKDDLLKGIFKGGHHTTLQHTHITMLITGMSRHLIWRLLHSHSFYNSEQVSQRYAKMKLESFVKSKNAPAEQWDAFYNKKFDEYEKLITLLEDDVRAVTPKFRQKDTLKRAQELARYILPVGMSAYLYHTVNVITLLRYIAIAPSLSEATLEAMEFADIIAAQLIEVDEALRPLVEHAQKNPSNFHLDDFANIKQEQNISKEVQVYDVVGDASFDVNENYADVLRGSQMSFDQGMLGGFTTYIKMSFSADAQNQRHRRSPAVRGDVEMTYSRDYYIPPIIEKNSEALKVYKDAIETTYDFYEEQREIIGSSEAIYALSNAHKIEIVERNDFSSFHHKAQMRLCYNAQQEIYDVVYEQVKQLRDLKVKGAENFLPPCSIRKEMNIKPICPEGDHFCGVKVWKLDFEDFTREM